MAEKETKRQKQVGEIIKRHFSMVLFQEGTMIYGSEALVSVTQVKMTPDMGLAKIYVSIYNTENKQAVILLLEENSHRLKQLLSQRIRKQMRRVPNIAIYLDDTLDEMNRLNELFDSLK
jgi:ribosome-binding factor A